jgi:hypothetical protein
MLTVIPKSDERPGHGINAGLPEADEQPTRATDARISQIARTTLGRRHGTDRSANRTANRVRRMSSLTWHPGNRASS